MTLSQEERQLAEELGKLLAHSALEDEIKQVILDNLPKLSKTRIKDLIDSLKKEDVALDQLNDELKKFEEAQDKNWQEATKQQEELALKIVDKIIQKIEDELKVKQLKKELDIA